MEERAKLPGKFFDADKLLVDRAIGDPFSLLIDSNVRTHSFDDGQSSGYIRYTLRDNSLIIIDCVITRTKPGKE